MKEYFKVMNSTPSSPVVSGGGSFGGSLGGSLGGSSGGSSIKKQKRWNCFMVLLSYIIIPHQ